MPLGSTNYFFTQDAKTLNQYRIVVGRYLVIKDFTPEQIKYILDMYDMMVANPSAYDGATASQDLYDVGKLEIGAMYHDGLYAFFKAHTSRKYMKMADVVMREIMRKTNKAGIEYKWRMFRLWWLRGPYPLYQRWIKRRRMNVYDKQYVRAVYTAFAKT